MTRRHKPTIIDQLRDALAAAIKSGTTQVEVKEATGIDQGQLSAFLSGTKSLSLERAAELCRYLKLRLVGPK